jgi:cytosine/adenosine deaminase-related metal-dependent hydrolase
VHGRLDRDFVRRPGGEKAAVVDVFALGILADHDEIDWRVVAQRPLHSGECPRRSHAGVEIEGLPQPDQRRQRDVIRQPRRPANRAEKNRVEATERFAEKSSGATRTVPVIVRHAPIEALVRELEAADALACRQDIDRRIHHFATNSISRVQRNAVGFSLAEKAILSGGRRGREGMNKPDVLLCAVCGLP